MAHFANARLAVSELGGQHLQDRRLVYDTPVGIRNSAQRSSSSDDSAPRSTSHPGGRGSGHSTSEETTNEDDDEDSSSAQEDDQEDEEEDPEVLAPSHGLGKGKGKCPAIRIESVDDGESQDDDEEISSHGAGYKTSKHPVNQLLMTNKKRTFSNVSNTSVLFGTDDDEQASFPRRKIARKLSNSSKKPLLTYKEKADEEHAASFEDAIETDDEDYSGVNLIPDDDSDVENVEQEEENFIINEEQQAAALISEYNDARRLSLDSHASDNIFGVTAPLDDDFLANITIPDVGFGQFFEPEVLPSSPDPSTKRKYSDSSIKRVRFDDEVQVSDSSSSSSSELDSSLFPDLFLEQDKLPPSLYQLLENDNDDDGDLLSPMSDVSFWDYGQDETRNIQGQTSDDFDDSSDPGSSGYETDMGDTTDECDSDFGSDAPPQTPLQKKSILRRPSSAPGSKASSPKPFLRSSRVGPTGGTIIPPPRGIFIHKESNEAIAVTNRTTKTLTFYRPRASMSGWVPMGGSHSSTASTANNSPRTSLAQFNASDSEMSNDVFSNPFTTDIMLTGVFGSAPANNFLFGGETIGPPEAFYPFVSIGQNGAVVDVNEDEFEDDDDYEDDLNIADFMDFGSDVDATDLEQDEETDVPATPATSTIAMNGSTPARPTPLTETPANRKRNASDAMLEHFDRGVVTAFRNNQNRYRDIACLPHDPSLRASVSRPIRSGKSAETLISPLRKRSMSKKGASSSFNASSPLSRVTKATSRLSSSVNGRRGPRMGTFS